MHINSEQNVLEAPRTSEIVKRKVSTSFANMQPNKGLSKTDFSLDENDELIPRAPMDKTLKKSGP